MDETFPNWCQTATLSISCARGLGPMLLGEVRALGYEVLAAGETAVEVRGTLLDAMALNFWLRTAHRVLWPLTRLRCERLDELYEAARDLPWEEWIPVEGYFTVNTHVHNDHVRDTRMPALRLKDAVADRIREARGRRPDSGSEFRGAALFILWQESDVRIFIDTTGEPLSRRGYRKIPWLAPMQETLAAGCVLASGWDGRSPFVAPMCGSGTPAIEAALVAMGRAPGTWRDPLALRSLRGFNAPLPAETPEAQPRAVGPAARAAAAGEGTPAAVWEALKRQAAAAERTTGLPPIVATDIAPEAIEASRQNAVAAGVEGLIQFGVCDFAQTPVPPEPGVVFLNPEYGERLGRAADLDAVYPRIGDFLKRTCTGYRGYVLTGNLALARRIGLHVQRRTVLYNGPIECRLLAFEVYAGSRRPPPAGG